MKRYLLLLGLCLFVLPLQAAPGMSYGPGHTPHQAPGFDPTGLSEPAMVLRHGIETLTGYLDGRAGQIPPAQLQIFLQQRIAPYFDFEHMSWWAAGPLNRHLTVAQRERLAVLLEQRFMHALSEQLMGYRHAQLVYLPPRGNPMQGEVSLGVRVMAADAPPVQLDFRLYRNQAGEWRVYDVAANGISAVAHYRNEMSQTARRYGIEGLLQRLQ